MKKRGENVKKIKKTLFDKTWKKCIFIFLIIFILIFIGGFFSINYLNDAVNNAHIHSEFVVVSEKMYGDSSLSDYYIIIGNNKTYSIVNHDDGYAEKMFNDINVGQRYKFIVKEPEITDINHFSHILQVYNTTE